MRRAAQIASSAVISRTLRAGPPNVKFTARYNETFGRSVSIDSSPASAYDAFYVLAYAAYASGIDAPLTGPALAAAMTRIGADASSAPIEVGPAGIYRAFEVLRGSGTLDLEGVPARSLGPALLEHPVLHHHGDACGPASVLLLFHKRNVEPQP